jgi:hypothetical protein
MVDVQKHQRQRAAVAAGPGDLGLEDLVEARRLRSPVRPSVEAC